MTIENSTSQIHWRNAEGETVHADWRSLAGTAPPKRVEVIDDTTTADDAYRLASEGVGLLWSGDFQNARLLTQALKRRLDSKAQRSAAKASPAIVPMHTLFVQQRKAQALRTRVLSMLLLPFDADHGVPLRRAPDVRAVGLQARGPVDGHYVASFRELQGLIGAYEWRVKGVPIAALKASIHPHYGVFSPLRGEYVDMIAHAPLPPCLKSSGKTGVAFDIGTGTGVLAAVLARRGVHRIVATDQDPRALACALDNLTLLSVSGRVELLAADLFPTGQAQLIVCNPPWVPGLPTSPLERAVYDPDSRMLRGFLSGLAEHLAPGGEGWLILSDLAEHLGLRTRAELLGWIAAAGLKVMARADAKPQHARAADKTDPLFKARSAEVTSLWRLTAA